MQNMLLSAAAAGLLAASLVPADAASFLASALRTNTANPAIVRVADGCGVGRFRGVGGYCEGHRPVNMRKVCVVRGYPFSAVRRCHLVRM